MSCEEGAKQGNLCDKVKEGYFPERIAMLQQFLLPADQGQQTVPESSRWAVFIVGYKAGTDHRQGMLLEKQNLGL